MAENISTKSNPVLTKSITITKFRHYLDVIGISIGRSFKGESS